MPSQSKRFLGRLSSLKAFIIAPLVFLLLLGAVFAYSGLWPPMVVIESKSMQHADESSIGTIDTRDIVVVKKITSSDEVITYLDAVATGHTTYGELGDVIVYYKSGMSKPIIHRAMCNLVYNTTGGGFDVPALANVPSSMWSVTGDEKRWWNVEGVLELYDIGYQKVTLSIDLTAMLDYMKSPNYGGTPHGGLITMGDYNWYEGADGTYMGKYDQKWISTVKEPVKDEWLVGKARGELPWFGLLKLYATGTAPSYTPRNSVVDLIASVAAIVLLPIILDIILDLMKRRGVHLFGKNKVKDEGSDKRDPPE